MRAVGSGKLGECNAVIRRATIDDLDRLLPLVRGYREFYQQPHDARGEREFMDRHLAAGTSIVFLALDDAGNAVGFTQLFETFSTVHLSSTLILEDLFVLPGARTTGIASALLETAVAHARESGASGMFLETAMDNTTAQRVYERHGWAREARFYKYNASLLRD